MIGANSRNTMSKVSVKAARADAAPESSTGPYARSFTSSR
jgi:hypothetical protein